MHIITITIALKDGTDDKVAEVLKDKTEVMVTRFMSFMNQEESDIAVTLEKTE